MEMKREMKDEGAFKHLMDSLQCYFLYLKSMQLALTITQSHKIYRRLLIRL